MRNAAISALTLAAALAFAPLVTSEAKAATVILDFSGDICGVGGNEVCLDNKQIGQNYGDGAGVDVVYRSFDSNGALVDPFLRYWLGEYSDLTGVVWGGNNATHGSEMTFAALPGFELTVLGFDAGCYQNAVSCQSFPFLLTRLDGPSLAGVNEPSGGIHDSKSFTLPYSSVGYVLSWGPDGYNGGLDNIAFDVRAVAGGVPEPTTWALMILGFGMAGAMQRRAARAARRAPATA